jgi:soluble lytic murein transglycosylase-like protein
VVTAAEVAQRHDELAALLATAAATLARLSARAKTLVAAEAAAARLRALAAQVERTAAARIAAARAVAVPGGLRSLYVAAARTCKGLPWTVVAAIGQVESGHGRNTAMSYAGAQGPMQFMPATFASYGVDGDGDGIADIHNAADSIFSAANYLCANGGGRGPGPLARAIWHYNHADWYVALVLKIASQLPAKP